jgi:hypothetical protein
MKVFVKKAHPMAQIIHAEFQTEAERNKALAVLSHEGALGSVEDDPSPSSEDIGPDSDRLVTANGGRRWSTAIRAPFGKAARVMEVLKQSGAVEVTEVVESKRRTTQRATYGVRTSGEELDSTSDSDRSFFVSALFGLPLLIDCPAPLSRLLRIPTIISD